MLGAIACDTKSLEDTGDSKWLHKALALAEFCIVDCRDDPRELVTLLADLHLAAVRVGIDPQPYFDEVATLAPQDEWGVSSQSLSTIFHNHAWATDNVRPEFEKIAV